jgi:hypothetical protein
VAGHFLPRRVVRRQSPRQEAIASASGANLTFGTRALAPSCPRKRAPKATNSVPPTPGPRFRGGGDDGEHGNHPTPRVRRARYSGTFGGFRTAPTISAGHPLGSSARKLRSAARPRGILLPACNFRQQSGPLEIICRTQMGSACRPGAMRKRLEIWNSKAAPEGAASSSLVRACYVDLRCRRTKPKPTRAAPSNARDVGSGTPGVEVVGTPSAAMLTE